MHEALLFDIEFSIAHDIVVMTHSSYSLRSTLFVLHLSKGQTKDLRRSEFKQILERYDKTIEILEEILRLKQLKYIYLGINIDKPKLKDNQ